ncbi:D-alanine--D-alanine ligase [Candidatus Riesia pediculicola]|uniref:D-alanine--D-alanine ligase n=1 Tax=Riesia pediculicola (strain USDA) TaxID=515618 RepID=D4G8Q9_RIEPU|nr:D-alanine--D-alanine ligase [Candidatus Riesia pediculicola]ADD79621.1 D-alanine--D-alanine ligase B [Candidatus Riesia pediculicola USDA]QOJ86557.1 D-alanine--D-alanine ligase [Candidatus Riesia pediculicola]
MRYKELKVAILYGGNSSERTISLKSGKNIANSLKDLGIQSDLIDTKYQFSIDRIASVRYDKIFIALHGKNGEDGTIQRILDKFKMNYTGNGFYSSFIGTHKILTKKIWFSLKLPTAPFFYINKKSFFMQPRSAISSVFKKIGFPLIIKPDSEGSSIGVRKAFSLKEAERILVESFKYDRYIIIEKYIIGPEYTVSILNPYYILPSIKIDLYGDEIFSYGNKYDKFVEYICPGGSSQSKEILIKKIALAAYKAIGCFGLSRVDLKQNYDGNFYLLEINTVPGMTDRSLVKIAAEQSGMSFSKLVGKILY